MMYILTLLCTTLSITDLAFFCCLTMKGKRKVLFTILLSCVCPALLLSLDFLGIAGITEGHPLRSGIGFFVLLLLVHIFFQESIYKKLTIIAVGASVQMLCMFLIAYPFAALGYFEPTISQEDLTPQFLIPQYLSILAELTVMIMIAVLMRKRNFKSFEGWKLLSLFVVVQAVLAGSSYLGIKDVIPEDLLTLSIFLSIICIGADFFIFHIICEVDKKSRLEAAAEFYKTQLSMQLSLYENFSAYGESLRQTKQDLVESLSQAQQSLKSRDYSSAEKMLKPLPQELEKLRTISYCEHRIVNALLFVKQRKMKQYGISFDCRVRLAEDCFVEGSHLCRILSNLLDNAIEACREIPNAEIHLTCMPVKDTLLMKTENPVSGSIPIQKNGLPASTKKEFGHGKGLASVKEIVDRYHGELRIEQKSSMFLVSVALFQKTGGKGEC